MRFLVVVLAALSAVWAQDPEGFPTFTSSISVSTPRTWASTVTTRPAPYPTYTPVSISWTTVTSDGTLYQIAVTPKTTAYTTISTGGGVWVIPVSATSSVQAVATSGSGSSDQAAPAHSSHKTRTIVLSVIFSFLGAVLLVFGAMFFMRVRNQRRMRQRRSWTQRHTGWTTEPKDAYPLDPEINTRASFAEPQVPAPALSHTRERSM
ncbi:hypothetical protein RhiJN_02255 [Ceratobasidium sp. AG-Ba]|nr:hypothetical protein RhiJN_02255 [Ceratobasidium sp. AG-Ba]QRW03193.1 hypothetical protein RhiLY_02192 [Ceratobasidium sp. AG-Ba]